LSWHREAIERRRERAVQAEGTPNTFPPALQGKARPAVLQRNLRCGIVTLSSLVNPHIRNWQIMGLITVTGCAEATYPPAKGVQTSSPQHNVKLAAPKCWPERGKEGAELLNASEGNRSGKDSGLQPSRTLRCRERGMLGKQTMEQERSHSVSGPQPLEQPL
jgi:hypothetical protein